MRWRLLALFGYPATRALVKLRQAHPNCYTKKPLDGKKEIAAADLPPDYFFIYPDSWQSRHYIEGKNRIEMMESIWAVSK